ncbi:MAG: hypothetical protein JXM73_16110 [Anaerolineae bacterium]|nr:hypothetical protein [Anaerolineae bacterium]
MRTTTGQGIILEGQLDTADLPSDLGDRMEEILRPRRLTTVAKAPIRRSMVDMQRYELTLLPKSSRGKPRTFEFSDAAAGEDLVELLDELTHEITLQKVRALSEG